MGQHLRREMIELYVWVYGRLVRVGECQANAAPGPKLFELSTTGYVTHDVAVTPRRLELVQCSNVQAKFNPSFHNLRYYVGPDDLVKPAFLRADSAQSGSSSWLMRNVWLGEISEEA